MKRNAENDENEKGMCFSTGWKYVFLSERAGN